MRIVYFANHGNTGTDDSEGHISYSLEKLGHEVIKVKEGDLSKIPEKADLFLFHKGGPKILDALKRVKYSKVFWYFDKVWNDRPQWFASVVPRVTMGFLTDETWLKLNPNPKLHILHQGIGEESATLGMKIPKYIGKKIAFLGTPYNGRGEFIKKLQDRYGDDFIQVNNMFNKDLYDFCATVPIIVAPPYPSDDYYWSSRIYMVMGSNGFMVHPHLKGLDREYINGVDYAGYKDEKDMFNLIDYYLSHEKEREAIRSNGYKKTMENYTYTRRIAGLLTAFESNNKC